MKVPVCILAQAISFSGIFHRNGCGNQALIVAVHSESGFPDVLLLYIPRPVGDLF